MPDDKREWWHGTISTCVVGHCWGCGAMWHTNVRNEAEAVGAAMALGWEKDYGKWYCLKCIQDTRAEARND